MLKHIWFPPQPVRVAIFLSERPKFLPYGAPGARLGTTAIVCSISLWIISGESEKRQSVVVAAILIVDDDC